MRMEIYFKFSQASYIESTPLINKTTEAYYNLIIADGAPSCKAGLPLDLMAISSTTANLRYVTEPAGGVRAYQGSEADPITGERKRNYGFESKDVVVENLRGRENSVTLDTAGFQYFEHKSKHSSFTNDEEIYQEYYPESIELIKSLTGASRVVLFDHSMHAFSFIMQ